MRSVRFLAILIVLGLISAAASAQIIQTGTMSGTV